LILGHHYQQYEVIALSDLRGDSYQLSKMAASSRDGQPWVRDVAFREDVARQQDRNGSVNLGAIRRLIVDKDIPMKPNSAMLVPQRHHGSRGCDAGLCDRHAQR